MKKLLITAAILASTAAYAQSPDFYGPNEKVYEPGSSTHSNYRVLRITLPKGYEGTNIPWWFKQRGHPGSPAMIERTPNWAPERPTNGTPYTIFMSDKAIAVDQLVKRELKR